MRLFLALDVSVAQFDLKKLKVSLNKGKNFQHQWIPDEQRHIPLISLSEMGREKLSNLKASLDSLLSKTSPLELKLSGVWAHPQQDHARVFWIGVQNSRELRSLHEYLESNLSDFIPSDLEEEKVFKPSLPIIRLRNYRSVTNLISPYKNAEFGVVKINRIMLYEMVSGGAFPKYRLEHSFTLFEKDSVKDLEDFNHLGG